MFRPVQITSSSIGKDMGIETRVQEKVQKVEDRIRQVVGEGLRDLRLDTSKINRESDGMEKS
jgi:hypothetical protein